MPVLAPMPLPGGQKPPIIPPKLAPGGYADEQEPPGQPEEAQTPPGHLVLSEERLKWLVDLALLRIKEVSEEMGREPDGSIQPGSWMDEMDINRKSYDKDLEWRRTRPEMRGTIFAEGMNLTWGASSKRVRLLSARVRDTLMGTTPFFACMTGRNGKPALTKAAESYLQERIEAGNVTGSIRSGIRLALALNHAVLKTTYKVDRTPFVGPARGVFVYPSGHASAGQPVTTVTVKTVSGESSIRPIKGKYVYEKDDTLPDPNVEGLLRLKKDPAFSFMAGQYDSADFDALEQELTHYDGAESKVVDFRDFLCPLKVETIHEADINVHLYHRTVGQLGLAYADYEASQAYFRNDSRVGAEKAIAIRGEKDEMGSRAIQKVLVAECYLRCQIHDDVGDPREYEIMLVLDVDNQKAIFYDYLGNHMPKRPFAVIPGVQKVDGRWYGIGVFTMMAHPDMYTDAQLNRINQKDSRAASATFFYPEASPDWKGGARPELGSNNMVPLNQNWDPSKPPIFIEKLQEKAELGMELMREVRVAADDEFAIQSAAAASEVDANRSNTATGVNNIERDANLVSRDNMYDITEAIEEVLWQAIDMELEHMDQEVMAYSADGSELTTLNRDEIRALEKDVRLLLTKSRSSEGLATNSQAEACAHRYWTLPLDERKALRPLFIREMRYLEIDDSDEMLPDVTDDEIAAWKKVQANQKPPDKPVSESIAWKPSDLTPDERRQALLKMGIQASAPADVAAIQTQKTASEIAVKQAAPPHLPEAKPNAQTPNP